MHSVAIGELDVVSLLDTTFSMSLSNVHPDADEEAFAEFLVDGQIMMPCSCFLIRMRGGNVLIDAGMGPDGDGLLPARLVESGITPADIDVVLFTHLHSDHIGWSFDHARHRPYFSNARYLAPRIDWDHYSTVDPPSESFARYAAPLGALDCVELIDPGFVLNGVVTAVATPGHTPGHLSFALESRGRRAFVLGDVVLSRVDVADAEQRNTFDHDGTMAMHTRSATLRQLEREGSIVCASHMPEEGLGRFVRVGHRLEWHGIAASLPR